MIAMTDRVLVQIAGVGTPMLDVEAYKVTLRPVAVSFWQGGECISWRDAHFQEGRQ
jgi:hypothetical protein